ncbi:MAG: sulfatase, partial [Acidobacteriota bacterium]
GWSIRERGGTWAVGRQSDLDFRLETVSARTLILNTNSTGDLFERPQYASVTLNGNTLGRVKISNSNPLSTLRMPVETQAVGLNRLVFNFDHTVRPSDRRGSGDSRPLAAWFRNVAIMEGSFGEIAASIRTIRMFSKFGRDRTAPPANISRNRRLVVRKAGTIVTSVNPDGPKQLEFEIRPRSSADSLFVTAHDLMDQSAPVSLSIEPGASGPARATIQLPADFETAFLEIKVPTIEDRPLRITAPWLTDIDLPTRVTVKQSDTIEDRPVNLVVVILDAARTDRFGCYGADRLTTPHIDVLAADSVVFTDAVALAPYTLCSVPTMATGLSFLDHGVVNRGQSLSNESTTLAEVLAEAGYTTAAFSATPNNSKKLGVDQGYQIFEEAWRGVKRGPALDPHRLVDMAVAWLRDQPQDLPFHLMVHMVPPHEPYEPGPAFDQFSDPNYQGPADGSRAFIDLFNHDPATITRGDLEQPRALYDGNLLKADDAVGRLLSALRKRRDWERTAVLVTSDHGEALGEHSKIGHNASVYEEMVRVPFILKLPQGIDPPGEELISQPASLADLAPTMAALAGQNFPDPVTGRDLLAEAAAHPRAMVIRTAHEHPIYGLRTPRWKLVVRTPAELELFDLSNDRGETTNCAEEHRIITAGLRQVLLARLAAKPLYTAADEGGLTGQDEAMLKTLGYIE